VAIRVNGHELPVSAVVSTAPVDVLARIIECSDLLAPFKAFRYRSMIHVNLRFAGRGLLEDVVVWTPRRDLPFFRLTEAPLSMPWLAPEGRTLLTADIGAAEGDPNWASNDDDLGLRCVDAIEELVPGARARYRGCRVLRSKVAYPVFLREYEGHRQRLEREGTGIQGLWSVGRNGEFGHHLMEDVWVRTRRHMRALVDEWRAAGDVPRIGAAG
jgi:protoporphyrinogen oxidase